MEEITLVEEPTFNESLKRGKEILDVKENTSGDHVTQIDPPKLSRNQLSSDLYIKDQWFKTITAFVSLISLGLFRSVFGPSLLDLEMLLNADTKTVATGLIGHRCGFFTGAILIGLFYDRFNPDIQFSLFSLVLVVATMLIPVTETMPGFIVFIFLNGVGFGYVDVGINPYILSNVWKGNRWSNPILQGAHAMFMLGAAVGPAIMQPFLTDTIYTRHLSNNSMESKENCTNTTILNADTEVKMGYVLIGILCLPACLLYFVAYLRSDKKILLPDREKDREANASHDPHARHQHLIMLIFLCLLFIFYLLLETGFGAFLAIYVVKGLGWAKYQGSSITTVCWAATFAGRVIAIPISAVLSPGPIIIIDLCLMCCACAIFFLGTFIALPEIITWIAAALVGLGFSSFFATCFLWAAVYMRVDGKVSSAIMVTGTIGSISSPFLVGHLFQLYSPYWFSYIMFGATILLALIYLCAAFYVRTSGIKSLAMVEKENKTVQYTQESHEMLKGFKEKVVYDQEENT